MLRSIALFAFLAITSCSYDIVAPTSQDFQVITIDAGIDVYDAEDANEHCNDVSIELNDFSWCDCHPECCSSLEWFCAPEFGKPTLQKMQVTMNFCDSNLEICNPLLTSNCPPPQIIHMSECYDAYACPPGAQDLDYGWSICELPNGQPGKQQAKCDKGQLYFSECQGCEEEVCDGIDNDCNGQTDEDVPIISCENECGPGEGVCIDGNTVCIGEEPGEEICDYKDNDCDGEVDEGQRNACDECGPLQTEVCDNVDTDCNGKTDEDLFSLCDTACESGVSYCFGGQWIGCTAQVPTVEVCDGIDNDCDGEIDEDLECLCSIQNVGVLIPCLEEPLVCGQGYKTCLCEDENCEKINVSPCLASCHWFSNPYGSDPNCDAYAGIPLQEEICNDFDDNCNAEIDEDLFANCYTGPAGTLGIGICKPGIAVCNAGKWGAMAGDIFVPDLCADEVLPGPEECNGIDDNCDGVTDWNEEINETDILFIVDWSGSMQEEIESVLVAMNQFASNYELEEKIKWGLIVGPVSIGFYDQLQMIANISTLEEFLSSFGSAGALKATAAYEMLLDALYLSIKNITSYDLYDVEELQWNGIIADSIPPKNEFQVNWRQNSDRIIVLLSDEKPQSFIFPLITEEYVASMCDEATSLKVHTFSLLGQWDYIADSCNGTSFPLSSSNAENYDSLMQILEEICNPVGN